MKKKKESNLIIIIAILIAVALSYVIAFHMKLIIVVVSIIVSVLVIAFVIKICMHFAEKARTKKEMEERLRAEEEQRKVRQQQIEEENHRRGEMLKHEEERKKIRQQIIEEQRRQEYEESKRKREEFLENKRNQFKSEVDALPLFEITLSGEKHNRNNVIYAETKNITKSTSINKIKDFVALSVETTGIKVSGNDIIRVSAVKYNNFKAVQIFDTYTKPRKSIPADATAVNGITDEMVANAPYFYQIINSFNEFIENLPLVAHNASNFQIKHLYVNGLDSVENKTIYCTLELSKRIMKDEYSYKLKDICESANIYMIDINSIYKSFAVGELFKYLIAERRDIIVSQLVSLME